MHPSGKMLIVRPIGEDLVPDLRILRLHVKSSLARNPVLQLLFEISKEPPGQGNCLLTTLMARFGKRSFLLFFHIPVGGCQDPSICTAALGRFIVTRFKRRLVPASLKREFAKCSQKGKRRGEKTKGHVREGVRPGSRLPESGS